eukprot:COSAG06_NODE_10292_length_1709_cov_2.639934_2_plen_53_part_00
MAQSCQVCGGASGMFLLGSLLILLVLVKAGIWFYLRPCQLVVGVEKVNLEKT